MRNNLKLAFAPGRRKDSLLISPELDSLRARDRKSRMHAGRPVLDLATRLAYIQGAISGTPYDDWMMLTDDSHWEPEVDYASLAQCMGTICTRGGGPTSWTEGAYNDSPDPYWFSKAQKIRDTRASLGSYWVANFGLMLYDFKRPAPMIDAMKTAWFGKYVPDWIALDFEVNTFWRGSTRITIPNNNLVTALGPLLEAMWEEWRKTVFVYSRVTFMQEVGLMADGTDGMRNVFDQKNKGDTRFPLWLAYYPTPAYIAKELSPDPDQAKLLLPPKTENNRKYLEYGLTKPAHIAWQFSPKMTWKGKELDFSIFPMLKGQFNEWIGYTPVVPPPPPPPPDEPPPDDGEYVTRAEFLAHQHGKPVVAG